jgi:hypothetical protein
MRCTECEDGGKMPLNAKLSVGIVWCPKCTACIKYSVAFETARANMHEAMNRHHAALKQIGALP